MSYRKRFLIAIGGVSGGIVGYLKGYLILAPMVLSLFLLFGGDSMRNTSGFSFSSIALQVVSALLFVGCGGYLGGLAGTEGKSPAANAAAARAFVLEAGLLCLICWLIPDPGKIISMGVDHLKARAKAEGHHMIDSAEVVRRDPQGWDLILKTSGKAGGPYSLKLGLIWGGKHPMMMNFKTLALELPPGPRESTIPIPFEEVRRAANDRIQDFANRTGEPTQPIMLEVAVEPKMEPDSPYAGYEWQAFPRKTVALDGVLFPLP